MRWDGDDGEQWIIMMPDDRWVLLGWGKKAWNAKLPFLNIF